MIKPDEHGVGTQRVLAATVAVAMGTVMWESGELSQARYVDAVMLGNGIAGGTVPVMEGLAGLMRLLMSEPELWGEDGY